jgi:hypothetical protein
LTGSAAQHLTSELEQYTNATLFGEPTGSKPNQYGSMDRFNLPDSGLEIACASKFFQDARPADFSMSSTPDIFVRLSSDDFKNNRDPVLDRIMDYDSIKDLKPAFFTSMSKAYLDRGTAGLKEAYSAIVPRYAELGFNMEVLLYDDFDGWIAGNRRSDADYIEFLQWLHDILPGSARVAYDLAYWKRETGDKEGARELYNKCLMLNPEHHRARWRLGLMELEEAGRAER